MPKFELSEPPNNDEVFGSVSYGDPLILSAIINGVIYSLDDGTFCYWVGDDGLGMAPMHRLAERGPMQHGDTDRGYRLDPRIVRLVLDVIENSQVEFENQRSNLINIFKPTNHPIILQFEMASGTYCLECYSLGPISMPSSERLGWNQTVIVELKASDPTFYDPNMNIHTYTLIGGSDTCLVPTVIPMTIGIGATSLSITENIVYEGTTDVYPQIRITGPIVNPILTNNSTGEVLDFTGTTIAAEHYYDIDLRYGYKTIIDNHGVNQIEDLTDTSDLVSFHLGIDPDVPDGLNSITITGTGMEDDTRIVIYYYTRYLGI